MKIGIIGGGVMGCVLAYRLSQKGYEVHLVESAHQLGGLSTWFNYGDFIFDKYYHVILKSDNHLLDLIHTLQLSSHLHWQETKTGFLWKGRYISMSNHWEFLKFPALNLFQKFRLGAGIIWNNSVSNPRQLDGYTAQAWLTKIFGKSVYDTIWDPLLESKFGILKNEIPGTIIWSTMRRYASTRSKGDGKEWMGHLKGGGLKVLLEKLAGEISKKNGQFHLNTKVESIGYDDQRNVRVQCADKTLIFDRVISTVPSTLLENTTWKTALRKSLLVILGTTAVVAPWSYTVSKHVGKFVLLSVNSADALAGGLNSYLIKTGYQLIEAPNGRLTWVGPGMWTTNDDYLTPEEEKLPPVQRNDLLFKRVMEWVQTHPKDALYLETAKLANLWGFYPIFLELEERLIFGNIPIVIMFVLAMCALWKWRHEYRLTSRLWTVLIFVCFVALASCGSWRYRSPADSAMIALAVMFVYYKLTGDSLDLRFDGRAV